MLTGGNNFKNRTSKNKLIFLTHQSSKFKVKDIHNISLFYINYKNYTKKTIDFKTFMVPQNDTITKQDYTQNYLKILLNK